MKESHGRVVFVVRNNGNMVKATLVYGLRNKFGHDSGNCFQVIGYSEWWLENNKNNGLRGGSTSARGGIRNRGGGNTGVVDS